MNKKYNEIVKEAQKAFERLDKGQTYPMEYVIKRFEKAADEYSTDQLIGNMKDVLTKVASKREYIHQNEIGKLYDEMYGLSGGHTAFRHVLEDLLPADRQFAKVAYPGSNIRKMEEKNVEPVYKDSELSNAFSVLFSLGNSSSFGTYKPAEDRSVQKAVIAKLSSLGFSPMGVDIVQSNEHYTLCAANYQTKTSQKISALIPVQTTDGVAREPQLLVVGESVIDLDSRNLYACLKEQERHSTNQGRRKMASEREDDTPPVEVEKMVVPTSLEPFADLENALVAAASKFNHNQINMAISMLNSELASLGAPKTNIKIAGSDAHGLIFDVFIPTKLGKTVVQIPVEIHNNHPIIPSKFAASNGARDQKVYDFSKKGFESFLNSLSEKSESLNIARHSGELSKMSYHQLMDQMIEGVANKDYKLAEDALQVIEHRFGSEKFLVAFDQFSQLLKHSSEGSERKELIKAAYERGELIKVPTSVELYCPKLGLPVSKIAFDEKGRIIPKGRRAKANNQIQDTAVSTSRILFT